jgi:hypothetical protein
MSVQLVLFPQYFDGSSPLAAYDTQFMVDGINFFTVNTSGANVSLSAPVVQTAINSIVPTFNTYHRFSGNANSVVESSQLLVFVPDTGFLQKLSQLSIGVSYEVSININSNTGLTFYQYSGTLLQSSFTVSGTGVQTVSFTANTTSDTIVLFASGNVIINNISIQEAGQSNIGVSLENGQVICDLYEDENIPLTLSVDEFKNVAEKVQSYSKAFNLPATKRNNQIFDNIFEITRSYDGVVFNPYKKTKCVLKENGFILFEGYLRLIDIQDKNGEISYNVNLYSDTIALADYLKDRKFSDLDFTELEHLYNRTNIQRSWNDGTLGITYTNASTSGFRNAYDTVKYPFVDWEHQYTTDANNNPVLPDLESTFRPFIQVKYLIQRIFQGTPFTLNSSFFSTTDFEKLYMDFNFGTDVSMTTSGTEAYSMFYSFQFPFTALTMPITTSTTFTNLGLWNVSIPLSSGPPNYNGTTHRFTATQDGERYNINYSWTVENIDTSTRTVQFRWLKDTTVYNLSNVIAIPAGGEFTWTGYISQILTTGETFQPQFVSDDASGTKVRQKQNSTTQTASVQLTTQIVAATTNTLLQTMRGELGQWEFLKGLMTMFNLISTTDESNPNQINIETYRDVFINNSDSKQLNWTEKIDTEQIKLTPLTDLNKSTIFKFVEDDDDYCFNQYKANVGGHLYGSKVYVAWNEFNILEGEEEIVAEPFAATIPKQLETTYPEFIIPALYSRDDDGTCSGFDNSPRIMYNNGIKDLISCTYRIPAQNGITSTNQTQFLQFSHLTNIPTVSGSRDFNFGECQYVEGVGNTVPDNLFNLYWLPYLSELYNPDTKTMSIKVNLTPNDIATFRFYDTVIIKNREYRVNKIDYKPNDLATVEFILIP